jgi:2-polyprenyl-3-methyl-5-hydroxy-6-metoxy-1,4-benzoquinol methylase
MTEDKYYFEGKFSKGDYDFSFYYDENTLNEIVKNKGSGKVLDLGCGEGGLALALAENGFDVTCVDISKTAVEKIREEAKKRGVMINAICDDLDSYEFKESFDVIICMGVLHFVKDFERLVSDIKKHTNEDGINVLDVITGSEYFKEGEIRHMYSDWKILDYEEHEENFGMMEWMVAARR